MRATTLGDLARSGVLELGDGYRTKRSELSADGFRIIRVADVRDGRVYLVGPDHVSTAFRKQIGSKRAQAGDVLLTTKGTVGRVAIMPSHGGECVYSPQLCWFRIVDGEQIDARYLHFWLQSESFSRQADAMKGNTDMAPYISLSDLRGARIELPEVAQQRAIAEVLGALDDKIAANERLVDATLRLGQAEFQRRHEGMPTRSLGEIANVVLGGTPSRANADFWTGGTVPWLASGAVNDDIVIQPTEMITEEALNRSAAKIMPRGSTLIAITGATLGQVAWLGLPSSGNQSIVGIWSGVPAHDAWLQFAVRAQIPELLKKATGAAQQHVSKGDVLALNVPFDETCVETHGAVLAGLLDAATAREKESQKLATLRDTLLPALMSGRLTVKQAETTVSEAI